jgi:hypothetical protein
MTQSTAQSLSSAPSLAELLSQRRTKWNAATYAQRYERYFAPIRQQPLKILEIGIGGYDDPKDGGDSLRAWKAYFPNAQIYGIDIVDKTALEEDRIKTFRGSQDDPEFLARVLAEVGTPDIIIDDGSHRNDHVVASFKLLFPHLKDDGGIYVVEDTHFSYVPDIPHWKQLIGGDQPPSWAVYGGSLDLYQRQTMIGFFKRLADCLSYQDFFNPGYQPNYFDLHLVGVHFYRNQIFLLKGDNTAPGNFFDKNTLRPEWLEMMGLDPKAKLPGFVFPTIDDPSAPGPLK